MSFWDSCCWPLDRVSAVWLFDVYNVCGSVLEKHVSHWYNVLCIAESIAESVLPRATTAHCLVYQDIFAFMGQLDNPYYQMALKNGLFLTWGEWGQKCWHFPSLVTWTWRLGRGMPTTSSALHSSAAFSSRWWVWASERASLSFKQQIMTAVHCRVFGASVAIVYCSSFKFASHSAFSIGQNLLVQTVSFLLYQRQFCVGLQSRLLSIVQSWWIFTTSALLHCTIISVSIHHHTVPRCCGVFFRKQ